MPPNGSDAGKGLPPVLRLAATRSDSPHGPDSAGARLEPNEGMHSCSIPVIALFFLAARSAMIRQFRVERGLNRIFFWRRRHGHEPRRSGCRDVRVALWTVTRRR